MKVNKQSNTKLKHQKMNYIMYTSFTKNDYLVDNQNFEQKLISVPNKISLSNVCSFGNKRQTNMLISKCYTI